MTAGNLPDPERIHDTPGNCSPNGWPEESHDAGSSLPPDFQSLHTSQNNPADLCGQIHSDPIARRLTIQSLPPCPAQPTSKSIFFSRDFLSLIDTLLPPINPAKQDIPLIKHQAGKINFMHGNRLKFFTPASLKAPSHKEYFLFHSMWQVITVRFDDDFGVACRWFRNVPHSSSHYKKIFLCASVL